MANLDHLERLQQGVDAWNAWRTKEPSARPDLSRADLSRANLRGVDLGAADLKWADLRQTDLRGANLRESNLLRTDLSEANLEEAVLSGASLDGTILFRANLSGASLKRADLTQANLTGANLNGTDFRDASFAETVLSDLDLSACIGLETGRHYGSSSLDFRTLQRSGPLPLAFLRGSGLPDTLIEYLPSLLLPPVRHYSCFISYSSRDEDFVRRLHADLQDKGVRSWFAPEDMRIGDSILHTLDEAVRLRDKVLLVLSKASIASAWVENEVTKAFEEERRRGGVVLFPIRLDDAIFTTREAWAVRLRDNRQIGDFRRWKEHAVYRRMFDRLLHDLRVESDIENVGAALNRASSAIGIFGRGK
jgi:uncharacterized protein YjbI with pentapeptide repeats